MRFPGLPVSRRRHEAEVERVRRREHDEWQGFHSRQARFWRERVAELEQAIRAHHQSLVGQHALDEPRNMRLHAVLDGHGSQERGSDTGGLSDLTREEYDRLRQAAGEADGDH